MRPETLKILAPALLAIATLSAAAAAETRDYSCAPTAVRVDDRKIEILCAEPIVLNERSQDSFRQVDRFAYPMITQDFQPQLGSQVKLLDYYLEVAQNAIVHQRRLHVWFETDHSQSRLYGCEPSNCREIEALALTYAPATAAPPLVGATGEP